MLLRLQDRPHLARGRRRALGTLAAPREYAVGAVARGAREPSLVLAAARHCSRVNAPEPRTAGAACCGRRTRRRTRSLAFVLAVLLLHGGIAYDDDAWVRFRTRCDFAYCGWRRSGRGARLGGLEPRATRACFGVARLGNRMRAVRWLRRFAAARSKAANAASALLPVVRAYGAVQGARLCSGFDADLVEGASVLGSNHAIPRALRVASRPWLRSYKTYLRANQAWSMFAPEAPTEDGTMVVDAVTFGGRHIDPLHTVARPIRRADPPAGWRLTGSPCLRLFF